MTCLQREDFDTLASWLDPDVEVSTLATGREPVRGRDAVLETMRDAIARMYSIELTRYEQVDDDTVLGFGRARFPLEPHGFGEGTMTWLFELRGERLVRVRAFQEPDAAWEAIRARSPARD